MDDLTAVLATVEAIYSAPGSADNWPQAVESITKVSGGSAGAYFVLSGEDQSTEVAADYGYDAEDRVLYQSPYGVENDIRYQYMHNLIPGQVFRDLEFVTDAQAYHDSKWIQFQREKHGVFWCLCARVSPHNLWKDFIAINRLEAWGQHTDQEKIHLQLLLPHLSRAVELHRTVSRLESRYGAVLAVLDKLLVGLVIFDQAGRVIVSNTTAQAEADTTGAYRFTATGQLQLRHSPLQHRFEQLLAETLKTSKQEGRSEGGLLPLPCPNKSGTLLFELMPVRDDGFSDSDNIRGAALFVINPDRSEVADLLGLSKIFELTEAETDIARSLVEGLALNEIAEVRHSSVSTVRTQLKSVFAKTGTRSQAGLVRLALKANPPVA
ncbi:helix-turn-helix transcriptional regulator [Motiliproteus sp. SC1-56]|uniref:helix-turn-helix transcriptional regulator n=1 Tax=Motiliproteus sp. SC1-56 TaxID=2799565 RepID=UPI001A8D4620